MKSFLNACGLTDSLQLVVESQSAEDGELRLLHQPFAVIGRDPRADIVLNHARVSQRHAYVQVVDGRAFWVDLDSRTGTQSDGQPQKSGWLEGQRTVRAGPFVIRRVAGESHPDNERVQGILPRDVPLVARAQSRAPLAEVALEFLNGPAQSMAWPVHRVMSLIGSASGCKFRLTDASVSRFHGSLLRTEAGFWIIDLLGHHGITVNEMPVRFSQLADQDVLKIGRYQIRVKCRPSRVGSGNGLSIPARAKPFTPLAHHGRAAKGLMFPDWVAAVPPFEHAKEAENRAGFPAEIKAVTTSSPNVELVPSKAASVPVMAPSESAESMLVPLVNQFGLMQQQMFDQFQQAMAMMLQMFGTMHRDQMDVIRAELDQLSDLTEEFHALKTELSERMRAQDQTSPHKLVEGLDLSAVPSPGVSTSEPVSERSSGQEPVRVGVSSTAQSPLSAPQVPEHLSAPRPRVSTDPPLSNSRTAQPPSDGLREPDPSLQPKTYAASPPTEPERDSIVWLHKRILTLQRERETRWQKILKLLPGMS
jgi:pSer/pThr/pTyr-binding forkhead associated (FHA) protein